MNDEPIITIDPAHFHAALIHKDMLPGVCKTVHVFAPLGPELISHLQRMMGFNTRSERPTDWRVEVHAGPEFLATMLRQPPGNIAVLAGRNHTKIDTMLACVGAGLHMLADKPWIIRAEDLPKLQSLVAEAQRKNVIIFDIMTERHEITSILQRDLIRDPQIFGSLITGSTMEPAVSMESVHAVKKLVAGEPLRRPAAYFDIHRQGEGLTDVGTHLVDLVSWMIAANECVDTQRDVQLLAAERWPTRLSRSVYHHITGETEFPPHSVDPGRADSFAYYCNNRIDYLFRGHYVRLEARWDLELPAGDTHNAIFRGAKANVEIRQDPARPGPPELLVISRDAAVRRRLVEKLPEWNRRAPGFALVDEDHAVRIVIPEALRIGHEAHFAQVAREFLGYVRGQRQMPAWELPNLLAKYYVTTEGVELARRNSAVVS